ncbi:hypothetical protein [Neptuniibacter pectenicola]|uniref:hypothetical protein n=1 Tax=Neptuniibacter pectenicola TaxID=1806669 RepID=UPI000836F0F3|nr:hypothetical protein [Neptuniibacter pectenicola]
MNKLYSVLIISSAIAFSNVSIAGEKHYMGHPGDGPQGHMMEGKNHKAGASTEHVDKYGDGKHAKSKGKHYMMEDGDAGQGHMMKGEKHPSN